MATQALLFMAILLLSVTASNAATIEVTKHGSATVTVSTPDAVISCPPTCSATVTDGTVLELVATQDETNAELLGWAGATVGCENNTTCYLDTAQTHLATNGVYNVQAWAGYRQGAICRSGRGKGIMFHSSFQSAVAAVAAGTTKNSIIDCTVLGNNSSDMTLTSNVTLVGIWSQFSPYLPYGVMSALPIRIGTSLTITTGSLTVGTFAGKGSVIIK
jgi:hypothetical protein